MLKHILITGHNPKPKVPKVKRIIGTPTKKGDDFFLCRKCDQKISIHSRAVMSNLMRFQMHMVSHFQAELFSDVPNLQLYYCYHGGPKCSTPINSRITFLCHLSVAHHEFYTRYELLNNLVFATIYKLFLFDLDSDEWSTMIPDRLTKICGC